MQCEFDGAMPGITLVKPSGLSGEWLTRVLIALGIASSLMLLFLARSWRPAWELLARWPHLAGVAGGLVWWLFLSPSLLGWVVVAISLLSALRPVSGLR